MGSPYLSSGESITMTTHRVSVDSIPYDVMLTTHRLTLIDSRYARFEPRMIAFGDILTVKSGVASTGEPVIILSYTDAEETPREMNLIFSQQPGEHRKQERDHWVKKLMESIIAERTEPAAGDGVPAADTGGMQPSVRRWVAPEGIALHTPLTKRDTAPPEITITPDDKGTLFERPAPQNVPENGPGETEQDLFETGEPVETISRIVPEPAVPAVAKYDYGVIDEEGEGRFIPPAPLQDKDALHKFHTIVIPFVPASAPDSSGTPSQRVKSQEQQNIPTETILAAAASLIPKKPAGEPTVQDSHEDKAVVSGLPEDPGHSIEVTTEMVPVAAPGFSPARGAEPPAGKIPPVIRPAKESPPITTPAGKKARRKKKVPESSDGPAPHVADVKKAASTKPAGDIPDKKSPAPEPAWEESPEIHESVGTTREDPAVISVAGKRGKSRKHPAPEGIGNADSGGSEELAKEEQIPGHREPRGSKVPVKNGNRGMVMIIFVIVILLALTGATVLLLSDTPLISGTSQGPVTNPPVTTQPTTAPLALTTIPASGAGFRVVYNGDFAGELGNPGRLGPVYGTGDMFFPIQKNDGLMQASIQKQDNSGSILTVEAYNNGKMIYTRNVSTPMGSLAILIDARSGEIPGMAPVTTTGNQTEGKPIYY